MTYSSALFEDGANDLTSAQENKYRRLAEAINLQAGAEGAGDRLRLGRLC